jgi:hypothetical protein
MAGEVADWRSRWRWPPSASIWRWINHRRDQSRRHPRIEVDLPVRVQSLATSTIDGRTGNVSLSGAMLQLPDDPASNAALTYASNFRP